MLPKAQLTSHSMMSGSRWVIPPLWLSSGWDGVRGQMTWFGLQMAHIIQVKLTEINIHNQCTVSNSWAFHRCWQDKLELSMMVIHILFFCWLFHTHISQQGSPEERRPLCVSTFVHTLIHADICLEQAKHLRILWAHMSHFVNMQLLVQEVWGKAWNSAFLTGSWAFPFFLSCLFTDHIESMWTPSRWFGKAGL